MPADGAARAGVGRAGSFVADRSPVIGFDAAAPGFFWIAGQGGYGLPPELAELGFSADLVGPGRS